MATGRNPARLTIFQRIGVSRMDETRAGRIFNLGMLALITLNTAAVIFETEESLYLTNKALFDGFELFSIAIFSVEYVLRLWSCTGSERYRHPVMGRIRYALRAMSLIDLLSILPFYLQLILTGTTLVDLRFIRAVRLFRFFRLAKMGRYSQSVLRLGSVLRKKKEELTITLFAGGILLVVAASLMYFVERDAQPEAFSSIPNALWWGVVPLTTVGYGDIYPKTVLGKLISAVISFLGIGLFALPAGIIASGFASEIQKAPEGEMICPHCGMPIHDEHNQDK